MDLGVVSPGRSDPWRGREKEPFNSGKLKRVSPSWGKEHQERRRLVHEHDPPVTEELCRRALLRRPGAIATAPSAPAAPSLQYCWKAEQRRLHPG